MVIVAITAVIVAGLFKAAMVFGPNLPFMLFKGRITEEGRAVNSRIAVNILYRTDERIVPITLAYVLIAIS
jgi:hypothetical protein